MVKCSKCGDEIDEVSPELSVGERDLAFHVGCAPDDLLTDAVGEWNAIVNRGVAYFVNKYVPSGSRAAESKGRALDGEAMLDYTSRFNKMGKAYKLELDRRKKGAKRKS